MTGAAGAAAASAVSYLLGTSLLDMAPIIALLVQFVVGGGILAVVTVRVQRRGLAANADEVYERVAKNAGLQLEAAMARATAAEAQAQKAVAQARQVQAERDVIVASLRARIDKLEVQVKVRDRELLDMRRQLGLRDRREP